MVSPILHGDLMLISLIPLHLPHTAIANTATKRSRATKLTQGFIFLFIRHSSSNTSSSYRSAGKTDSGEWGCAACRHCTPSW